MRISRYADKILLAKLCNLIRVGSAEQAFLLQLVKSSFYSKASHTCLVFPTL